MSLEKNIERIAISLEKIAAAMESRPSAPVTAATAPVVQAAAAPVVQTAAAAPVVALVAAAPVVQAAAAPVTSNFDTAPVVQAAVVQLPPINTPEEMNTLLVAEFNRLGAIHGEGARNLIVTKLREVGGSESVQGIAPANYPAVLAAVKALV